MTIDDLRFSIWKRQEFYQSAIVNLKSTIKRLRSPETQFQKQEALPLKLPSGDQSEVEPPGPIPNPEVKRLSANGSGTIGPVRVGRRQVFARIQLALGPGSFFARMLRYTARSVETTSRSGDIGSPLRMESAWRRELRAPYAPSIRVGKQISPFLWKCRTLRQFLRRPSRGLSRRLGAAVTDGNRILEAFALACDVGGVK